MRDAACFLGLSIRLPSFGAPNWLRWLALLSLGVAALIFYRQIRVAGGAVSVQGNAYLGPGLGVALVAILGAVAGVVTGASILTGNRSWAAEESAGWRLALIAVHRAGFPGSISFRTANHLA